jgi:SAM-dependent methyltransferase
MTYRSPLYHYRSGCRLCNSAALTKVFALTPTPPANAFVSKEQLSTKQPTYPLELFFCENCSHLQLLGVVDPTELFRNYVYVSGTSASFIKHFSDYANTCIDDFNLSAGDLVIDIGSNDGTLLQFFQEKQLNVLGIDPARNISKQASKKGIETWPKFFNETVANKILETKGQVSLITANNMFAHADDLAGIVKSIRSLLTPSGVFIFEVSYLGAVFEDTLFDTIYHEHLAYHSVLPLAAFFDSNGMDFFAAERITSHGGSIRGMVQFNGGPHKKNGSVQALIDFEYKLKINLSQTWVGYAQRINTLRNKIINLLTRLKQEGKTIAGFGAPAKATTLMYHFGIGPEIIDFISDDAPLKQGLYSPGLHIPVLSSKAIYERKPDYVIILAWNFAAQIIENHKGYLKSGGHFIVPLPELRIT